MFGFFTKVRAEVADVKAKLEALEQRIEAFFKAVPEKAVEEVKATEAEAKDAVEEGKKPTTEAVSDAT